MMIEWLEEVGSTNDEALSRLSALNSMSVIAAVRQTKGKGQRGNKWHSKSGENITFSMVAHFSGQPEDLDRLLAKDQFEISIASTLAVVDYLSSKGIESRIKWPNDIYVQNRKICGMLVENVLDGRFIKSSVIGIGLNVNQKEFPPELPNPVSMCLVTGMDYDVRSELESLCLFLSKRLKGMNQFHDEYVKRLYRLGLWKEYYDGLTDERFTGRILGVSPSGLLQVETKEGEFKEFTFKEISYII